MTKHAIVLKNTTKYNIRESILQYRCRYFKSLKCDVAVYIQMMGVVTRVWRRWHWERQLTVSYVRTTTTRCYGDCSTWPPARRMFSGARRSTVAQHTPAANSAYITTSVRSTVRISHVLTLVFFVVKTRVELLQYDGYIMSQCCRSTSLLYLSRFFWYLLSKK